MSTELGDVDGVHEVPGTPHRKVCTGLFVTEFKGRNETKLQLGVNNNEGYIQLTKSGVWRLHHILKKWLATQE